MATPADWAKGYARQAQADFRAWQIFEGDADVQPCHRMLFLQMACEKLCKARLIDDGTLPDSLQTSHGYIANPLPIVIRAQLEYLGVKPDKMAGILRFTRLIAAEIEILNPSMNRNGKRPDNCEYPWEDAGLVLHSPLDWSFQPLNLLREPRGLSFVKLLQLAIQRAVDEFG